MFLAVSIALAGSLTLDDPAGRVTATDAARLTREVAALPFDVHASVDDSIDALDALTARAEALRADEGGLVVLVDPTHRHTALQIDETVGVKKAYFDDLRTAGDASFRDGAWGGGLIAIVERTDARRRGVAPAGVTTRRASAATPSPLDSVPWPFIGFLFTAAAIVIVAHLLGWRPGITSTRRSSTGFGGGITFGSNSSSDWGSSSSSSSSSSSDSGSSGGDSGGSSGSW